jgi:hypothetical protein
MNKVCVPRTKCWWEASLNQVDNKINHWECLPGSCRGWKSYRLDGSVL